MLKDACRQSDILVFPISVPGPTALVPRLACEDDLDKVLKLVCAFARYDKFEGEVAVNVIREGTAREIAVPRPYDRAPLLPFQLL